VYGEVCLVSSRTTGGGGPPLNGAGGERRLPGFEGIPLSLGGPLESDLNDGRILFGCSMRGGPFRLAGGGTTLLAYAVGCTSWGPGAAGS
jgi:hypothetical protein